MNNEEDSEIKNIIKVWSLALASLSYCYFISSKLPKGLPRLITLLPVITLFTVLPLKLNSYHFTGLTSFFLTWLSNFKLILFAFDLGPLSSSKSNLFHFLMISSLPIKISQSQPQQQPQPPNSRLILFIAKLTLLVLLFQVYDYRPHLNHYLLLVIYCFHLYLELELLLFLCATPARFFGFEIEPQFNEPYLTSSLQDFWGRRWNLMVTSILRPSVYHPILRFFSPLLGKDKAKLLGVVMVFAVSGLMHELIYYYLTHVSPTWEVTWFFILHGVCVSVEIVVKRSVAGRFELNKLVSGMLSLGFVAGTGFWLFFPQMLRSNLDDKVIGELEFVAGFVKRIVRL